MRELFLFVTMFVFCVSCDKNEMKEEIKEKTGLKSTQVNTGFILFNDFDDNQLGVYSWGDFNEDWGNTTQNIGIGTKKARIVKSNKPEMGKVLKIKYEKGAYNNDSKVQFKVHLENKYEELYCAYKVKFHTDFEFKKGGKLPGLAGGKCNCGGTKPNGYDGWSARLMWRKEGKIVNYVYHVDQPENHGEDFDWTILEKGPWYQLEYRVKMNTPKQNDGIIEAWVDGDRVLYVDNLRFRDTKDLQIDTFFFGTFYGGNDSGWAPDNDTYIYFDDFVLSQNRIYPKE